MADRAHVARRLAKSAEVLFRSRLQSRLPFEPEQSLRRRQTKNLSRTVAHALATVPYYREIATGRAISRTHFKTCADLAHLPLLDGASLQRAPLSFVSRGVSASSLIKLYSTGTAAYGAKIVYWTPEALESQIVHGERDRSVLRNLLGRSAGLVRVSFFHPESSTAMVSRFHAERLLIPRGTMRTRWASCELPFEDVMRVLDEEEPDVVYSYGSFAEAFLLHVRDRGWRVQLPKVWVYGGDTMTAEGRRAIERDLGCLTYSTYQAVEVGRIGFECEERSGYHVNVDFCHVRLVDERGETVDRGDVGEVVISNLYNRGTVLLNYRLGDRARWRTDRCPCGRTLPVLELTGARTSGALRLRAGGVVQEHVLLHACKESMHDVLQFQIVETAPESLVWRVVVARGADRAELASAIVDRSRSVLGPQAEIHVEFVDRLTPKGGKLTRIVRAGQYGEQMQAP